MNYVDLVEGEWYPDGGLGKIPSALVAIAEKNGVVFNFNADVTRIEVVNDKADSIVLANGEKHSFDMIVSNADIAYTDMTLLDKQYQQKSDQYWDNRRLAPSAFILYLGIEGSIPTLTHHNLLSALDWDKNFDQLTTHPEWPLDPSFYVCAPSKSDASVAPANAENLFVLVPIAPGLTYDQAHIDTYTDMVYDHLEKYLGIENIKNRVIYKRAYCVEDFIKDYNSFKGTALGLAHTLSQTALLRPNNVHKKVKNLFYVGAGTNPGIGVPICLISAELAYKRIEGIKSDSPLKGII
jgi:phytoene desaturase